MKTFILTVALSLWLGATCFSQVVGFWQVEKVEVGDKSMTPVAKWFKINADYTQQSGNGWLQNAEGTWLYDKENQLFTPVNNNSVVDEMGAFKVSIDGDKMFWEREEEGMLVKVTLFPIDKLPIGPADKLLGLWDVVKVEQEDKDITAEYDPDAKRYLFFKWDNRFIDDYGPENRINGTWQMNGHRPIVSLIKDDLSIEQFKIKFTEGNMTLTGKSKDNEGLKIYCTRITRFPKE